MRSSTYDEKTLFSLKNNIMSKDHSDKEFKKLIHKHIQKNNFVKIYLDENPDQFIYGIIVKMSDELVMTAEFDDFAFTGFKTVPEKRISSIRCNIYDKAMKRILSHEGAIKFSQKIIEKTALENFETFFRSLQKQDFHCSIGSTKKEAEIFSIGEILNANDKSVLIKNYNPAGKIDKKPQKINYKKIKLITFNDNYSMVFRKYLFE